MCGQSKPQTDFYTRASGRSSYCKACEQSVFDRMCGETGAHIALFACCMGFNEPFLPLLLPESEILQKQPEKWLYYNSVLAEKGYINRNGKRLTFFDGATNILKVFGRNLSARDTANYIRAETAKSDLPGTQEQRERWGTGNLYDDVPMTDEIYDRLDGMLRRRLETYKGITITPQMEDVLVRVTKMYAVCDILLSLGRVREISEIEKAANSMLSSEMLRKKDEKPVENLRIDALVVALEKAGLMENGQLLPYNELKRELLATFAEKKKYAQTVDVVDQAILIIDNTMRKNADMATLTELPDDMHVIDYNGEFAEAESEQEMAAKRYLGLTPMVKHAAEGN